MGQELLKQINDEMARTSSNTAMINGKRMTTEGQYIVEVPDYVPQDYKGAISRGTIDHFTNVQNQKATAANVNKFRARNAGEDLGSYLTAKQTSEMGQTGKSTVNFGGVPPPVNTSQPNPANVNATPYTDPLTGQQGSVIPNSQAYTSAGQLVTPPKDIKAGYEAAKNSGALPPQTGGEARGMVEAFSPETAVDNTPGITSFMEQDAGYQGLLAGYQEFNNFVNQRKSLTDEYKGLLKESGIPEMNTDLMNMKNVIEGSEDDLRNEITKAGGFGTESQIQILTMSRNKQLVKNYNNLLETKQQAMEMMNTMIGLVAQDRQLAMQAMEQKFNFQTKIIDYRDKMQQKAVDQYKYLADKMGFDGLLAQTGGDPYHVKLVEKTLGLGAGGLSQLAQQDRIKRQSELADKALDKQYKQAQIGDIAFDNQTARANLGLEREKFNWERNKSNVKASWQDVNGDGKKELVNDATGEIISDPNAGGQMASPEELAQKKANIDQISGLLTDKGIGRAVGTSRTSRSGLGGTIMEKITGRAGNFIASVEQITGQLVGKTLAELKAQGATFGALSDAELMLLQNSATKISKWAIRPDGPQGNVTGYQTTEKEFKKELDKINNFAKLNYVLKGGNPDDVGIRQMPDGKWLSPKSDGSFEDFTDELQGFNSAGKPQASNITSYTSQVGNGKIVKGSEYHSGNEIDVDGKIGDPIPAYRGGVVVEVSDSGRQGYGRKIVIQDDQGNRTIYGHLQGFNVKKGQRVNSGQIIGKMGNSGKTVAGKGGDGSHLHIERRDKNNKVIALGRS